jgi:hypothetical protein
MNGAFDKNPNREREDPDTGKLKSCPDHLSAAQRDIWKEIVKAAPKNVLTEADRFALEVCAVLLNQFRLDPVEFPAAKLVRLETLLGKFGMTPSDRAKVAGPAQKKPQGNPFAGL